MVTMAQSIDSIPCSNGDRREISKGNLLHCRRNTISYDSDGLAKGRIRSVDDNMQYVLSLTERIRFFSRSNEKIL